MQQHLKGLAKQKGGFEVMRTRKLKCEFKESCNFRDCGTIKGIRKKTEEKIEVLQQVYEMLTLENQMMATALSHVYESAKNADNTDELLLTLKGVRKKANEKSYMQSYKYYLDYLNLYIGQIDRANRKLKKQRKAKQMQQNEAEAAQDTN